MPEKSNKNIILVGMMGAGKSFIGKKLAKLLSHFNYIDIDAEIEKQEGITISEIFNIFSENHFRELESNVIKRYSGKKNLIISLGGGSFERKENRENLKQHGVCFYLKTTPDELYKRIKNEKNRPLLKTKDAQKTIKNLLEKRENNYKKADFTIDTTGKKAYTILNDIIKEYEENVK